MPIKNKEVKFSVTKDSAKKIAEGLSKALPGDKITIEALDTNVCIDIKNSKNNRGNLKSSICWLKTFIPFVDKGHDYNEIEKHENKDITVSECKKCGKIDISWI